jgi:3',5'-cyclic AMP phosphodiesterase CpdA
MRTLAHLSDLHFDRVDPAVLGPLRRKLHALAPDLVVVSGDLTQRARRKQFEAAVEYLETLPRPQLVVPGNHDIPLYNVFKRFLAPLANYKSVVSTDLSPEFIDDEIAVVGVNTARALVFKGGRINEKQMEAVRGKLCGLPQHVSKVIVTHHPFDVPKESDEEDQIVGRACKALKKLADCGADVLLSGHLHEANVGHTAERYRIAGVSALVVQAGTATSSRTRDSTNSFNLLRLEPRHIEVDTYLWTGSDFICRGTEAYDHDDHGWKNGSAHGPH